MQTSIRSTTDSTQRGDLQRTENDGGNSWKRLRSSLGLARDDDKSRGRGGWAATPKSGTAFLFWAIIKFFGQQPAAKIKKMKCLRNSLKENGIHSIQ